MRKINRIFKEMRNSYKIKKAIKECVIPDPSIEKDCNNCVSIEVCPKIVEKKAKFAIECPVTRMEMEYLPKCCYRCIAQKECNLFKELS